MRDTRIIPTVAVVVACVLALAACRAEEQGRPIHYQKGAYLGKRDTPLTDAQVESLRERTRHQAMSTSL